jgi:Superfamily I DNA and RNA helicases
MAWQDYFDYSHLFPNIEPTNEQLSVINQVETQMLINGEAGSGKSVTLLYKLIRDIAENHSSRILFVTYNQTLIEDALKRLSSSAKYNDLINQGSAVPVIETYHQLAWKLLKEMGFNELRKFKPTFGGLEKAEHDLKAKVIAVCDNFPLYMEKLYSTHDVQFLLDEFLWMKANGIVKLNDYLEVTRTGRGNAPRLTRDQRVAVFKLFNEYNMQIHEKSHMLDPEDYALLLLQHINEVDNAEKFDYVFADEIQDFSPMQLKSLSLLATKSLTLSGDSRQRIYMRSPLSYRALGIDIQGHRNRTLKRNFRSTKQIVRLANALKFSDTGMASNMNQTVASDHDGELPEIRCCKNYKELMQFLIKTIAEIFEKGPQSSIAIVHRSSSDELLNRMPIKDYLGKTYSLISVSQYGKRFSFDQYKKPIVFSDPFSIKGLEFDFVFVLDFDNDHYPNQNRIKQINQYYGKDRNTDPSYLKDFDTVFDQEKRILYVAVTRAKKKVWLLYQNKNPLKISQFVRDFNCDDYLAYGFDKHKYNS